MAGRGSQSGQHHNQQGEDGWTPVKPSRTQAIDPAKMKITKVGQRTGLTSHFLLPLTFESAKI